MSKAAPGLRKEDAPKEQRLREVQAHLLLDGVGDEGPKDLWGGRGSSDETNTWVPPWFHHKLTVGLSVSPSPLEMQSLTRSLEVARDPASLLSTPVMESGVLASSHNPSPSGSCQTRSPFSTLRTHGPKTRPVFNGRHKIPN